MIDEATEFGARVARREETIVWLTTVTPAGAPLPRPAGFLWDGGQSVSIYSQPAGRVRNIAANPKVTLNFAGDGSGGDIVVLSGTAQVDTDAPAADAVRDDAGLVRHALQRADPDPAHVSTVADGELEPAADAPPRSDRRGPVEADAVAWVFKLLGPDAVERAEESDQLGRVVGGDEAMEDAAVNADDAARV